MATYYADSVNGSDANDGSSEALAKQTLSAACALLTTAGDVLYVQAGGNYTLTSTITLTQDGSTAGGRIIIEGYTTTPGARDGRPTITTATNSTPLFTCNGATYLDFIHLEHTNTASTRDKGYIANTANSTNLRWIDCVFSGLSQAIAGNSAGFIGMSLQRCEIKNCTTVNVGAVVAGGSFFGNYFHDNAGDGISYSFVSSMLIHWNIFDSNGRYAVSDTTGSGSTFGALSIVSNVFYGQTSDGIRMTGDVNAAAPVEIANNIFYGNGGYGQNWTNLSSTEASALILFNTNNAYRNNTSGPLNGMTAGTDDVTLTADPFTSAAGGDFSLNNDAGGGAACRAAGYPGAFPGGLTTGYLDIGAAQHQDAGGGGSVIVVEDD